MRLVDPAIRPAPALPAPPKARPALRKDKPRRVRRISPPLPARETFSEPARVIAQDSVVNDFVVPLVRPEEAEQKTIDIQEARHGDDEGADADAAAVVAEAARAGERRAAEEAESIRVAEQERAAREQQRLAAQAAERAAAVEAQRDAEQVAARQQIEQDAARFREQQAAQQLQLAREAAEQLRVEQLRAERLRVEQQKAEQQLAEQKRFEQRRLAQQRAEQLRIEQERAELQQAERQRAEQQRAERQLAEQKAEQQRAEQQLAEQKAALQRDAAPPLRPGGGGAGGAAATPGGAGGAAQIPRNLMGSDLASRARDMVKGIDVLRGDPPVPRNGGARRAAVGAGERDMQLRMYAESWRQKIERNGSINYPRSWADTVRIDPLVSVAVRSDGSVEAVTIVVSSGRADMDEAVRRIVRINARYSPFPPPIAARYDVLDIRRVWRFDQALKLMEEVR